MIQKSHRLSNAFNHYFFPTADKLLSPQNIKIELWNLNTRKIELTFDPAISCINSIAFSRDGLRFVCLGGCIANASEFKIYETSSLQSCAEFSLVEQACNPVIGPDSHHIWFGTWEGHLYRFDTASSKLECMDRLENAMVTMLGADATRERLFLCVAPKVPEGANNWSGVDYVRTYHTKTGRTADINVPCGPLDRIRAVATISPAS